MRTVAGVGNLVQRTRDGRTGRVLGDRAVERSGGVVCGLEARVSWLSLKTKVVEGFPVWASKPAALVW
jgi:hypothetical protein